MEARVDGDSIELYVTDNENNRVILYNIPKSQLGNSQFYGASADTEEDKVWGQPNLSSDGSTVSDTGLVGPNYLSISGDFLYVSDRDVFSTTRIVREDLTEGDTTWDKVWGQPNFSSSGSGTSDTALGASANGIFVQNNRLAVADLGNERVVIDNNTENDTTWDRVLGQENFTSSTAGTSDTELNAPRDLGGDPSVLFVAELSNNRVIQFPGSGSSGSGNDENGVSCLLERTGTPEFMLDRLRTARDWMMHTAFGRTVIDWYYEL
ncbi:MAG: hypothetical protein ABEJ65_08725 [bacterium]